MWLYCIIKFFAKIYYFFAFRMIIIGKENIPAEGSAVLCCNHSSNYDPVTMAAYIDRLPRYIAKKELFENKFLGSVLHTVKAFPLDREAVIDMKAFKIAINVLKSGEMLGIFAEGTRVKEGEEKDAKAGVALFALKGDAPVIPICIVGKHKFRGRITMRIGEPMSLDAYRGQKVTTELLKEITDEIMEKITEMKGLA